MIEANRPLLQLALDLTREDEALAAARRVSQHVDLIEAGTPLILSVGLRVVRTLRHAFPDHTLVADVKIMDAPGLIAPMAFDAGADIITVMSASSPLVLTKAVDIARERGKRVMLDTLGTAITKGLIDLILETHVDFVCLHRPRGTPGMHALPVGPMAESLRRHRVPLAVAGGINEETVSSVMALAPRIVVVGEAITRARDPAMAAKEIRRRLG